MNLIPWLPILRRHDRHARTSGVIPTTHKPEFKKMENEQNIDALVAAFHDRHVLFAAERLVVAHERAVRLPGRLGCDHGACRLIIEAVGQGVPLGELAQHLGAAAHAAECRAESMVRDVEATLQAVQARRVSLAVYDGALGLAAKVVETEAGRLVAASLEVTSPDAHEFVALVRGGFSEAEARACIERVHAQREAEKREAVRRVFGVADDAMLPPIQTSAERAAAAREEAKQLRAVGDSIRRVRADPLRRMDGLPAWLKELIETLPEHTSPQGVLARVKAAISNDQGDTHVRA